MSLTERPVIESTLSDQTVAEGRSAVFDCVSRGTPPLSVTWFHNAVPLAVDDQSVRVESKSRVYFKVKRRRCMSALDPFYTLRSKDRFSVLSAGCNFHIITIVLFIQHQPLCTFVSSSTSFWYQFLRFRLTYSFTNHFFLFWFTTLHIYSSLSLSLPA